MINLNVIRQIRNSTCAIIYMPIKHEDSGLKPGDTGYGRIDNKVFATGFLIDEGLILTNRHVIRGIKDIYEKTNTLDNIYALFTFSEKEGGFTEHFVRIDKAFEFNDSTGRGVLDVGIIELKPDHNLNEFNIDPVKFDQLNQIKVGQEIAICGYPYGNEILFDDRGLSRFGPVIHHGIISALSPFDSVESRKTTTFLTDVNTAEGMSGSPVFLARNGKVIGLHYSGIQGKLGIAIPIDQERIDNWVGVFQEIDTKNIDDAKLRLINGGDVELIN